MMEDQDLGYEHQEIVTPPPEIDNIIEDPPVTTIPLSIDTVREEILTTTDTIIENSLPTGIIIYMLFL